jgi:hypothetical protein
VLYLAGESVISEELQSLLNVELGPEVYEVEKGMLRKFAEAIDDPDPRWLEEATGRASWSTCNPYGRATLSPSRLN